MSINPWVEVSEKTIREKIGFGVLIFGGLWV